MKYLYVIRGVLGDGASTYWCSLVPAVADHRCCCRRWPFLTSLIVLDFTWTFLPPPQRHCTPHSLLLMFVFGNILSPCVRARCWSGSDGRGHKMQVDVLSTLCHRHWQTLQSMYIMIRNLTQHSDGELVAQSELLRIRPIFTEPNPLNSSFFRLPLPQTKLFPRRNFFF